MRKLLVGAVCCAVIGGFAVSSFSTTNAAEEPAVPAWVKTVNDKLAAKGLNVQIANVDYFTIGKGRPADRILQQPFRWVSGDARRLAQGDDITYVIDEALGATASGLTAPQTTAAVERSMRTWDASKAHKKVDIVRRADDGGDHTIFDSFFGFGPPGNPFAADIVHAGFFPKAFFEAVGGPGGGDGILAFSVTFIFLDDDTGLPTDVNGDNYLDTALNEVYFNDTFGDPGSARAGNPWKIDAADRPDVDVETVSLHELGHSLGVGHFGPPPTSAVMNPIYAGLQHEPGPTDVAAMQTVWARWPK